MYFNSPGDSNMQPGLRTTGLETGRCQSEGPVHRAGILDFILKAEKSR